MTEYLTKYREYLLQSLASDSCDLKQLLDYHTEKIRFFQHERLIHLIVTVLFALASVITFIAVAAFELLILIPLALLFLALLIPYIKHYYFLENTVQLLYKDYDRIYERVYGFSQRDGDK